MSFQSCRILYPLLWQLAKKTPDGRTEFLCGQWDRLVGSPLCMKTEPAGITDDTLTVTACADAWGRALEKLSDILIPRINDLCGEESIKRMEFRVGPVQSKGTTCSARGKAVPGAATGESLSRRGSGGGFRQDALQATEAVAKNFRLRSC